MPSLIYISNTRIPSVKANTYQSMCMCEAFSRAGMEVEFWHPARTEDYASNAVADEFVLSDIFYRYNVDPVFRLKRLPTIDVPKIADVSRRLWFFLEATSFAFACLNALRRESSDKVVFVRDSVVMSLLALAKKLNIIQQKAFFEAHLYSQREHRHSRNLDGVVVINNQLKSLYGPEPPGRVIVAHDAVRKNELSSSAQRERPRADSTWIILYCGNLFPWKGVYTLADCAKYLPENCVVRFVGGSPDELVAFQDYVQGFPRVEVLGFKDRREVLACLDSADVLVLPNSAKNPLSLYTSPLKLFEYMAARKPIVAARIASLQEILRDGENAILFEPDDPQDLAKKISQALENDCRLLVDRAWQDVQTCTWDRRAEQIIQWMKERGALKDEYLLAAEAKDL